MEVIRRVGELRRALEQLPDDLPLLATSEGEPFDTVEVGATQNAEADGWMQEYRHPAFVLNLS